MRPVRVLSVYILFVFLGAALISPWLYGLVRVLSEWIPPLQTLASKPFPRYVNRSLLILALAGLMPFLRAADLRSWRDLGLSRRTDSWRQLGSGFGVGLVSLACVVVVTLGVGARLPVQHEGILEPLRQMGEAILTALIVAPLEELFFRGALFGLLRKTFHWSMALVISSVIYSLLHFLQHPGKVEHVGWNSGFVVLLAMLGGIADLDKVVPSFFNLTVVGMILGLAYQRTRTLHFSIGLHAGWIFWLKTYGFITQGAPDRASWFYGSSRMVDGWLALLVLGLWFVILITLLPQNDTQSGWRERRLFS